MRAFRLPLKEVEKLGYYDFMTYIGVPFFHIGGLNSTLELAKACRIDNTKKVLMAGCGTGLSSCFLAKKLGCHVTGIDIAELSIQGARERARQEYIEDKVTFQVGDAYNLSFDNNTFDVVMTEFVSMFLDTQRAFNEFARVLKPGGFLGINELYKRSNVPPDINGQLMQAERLFMEISKLKLTLYLCEDWSKFMENSGLKLIKLDTNTQSLSIRKLPEYNPKIKINSLVKVEEVKSKPQPKIVNLFVNLKEIVSLEHNRNKMKYWILSKTIRQRVNKYKTIKKIIFTHKPSCSYVGRVLGVAQKV